MLDEFSGGIWQRDVFLEEVFRQVFNGKNSSGCISEATTRSVERVL